MPLIFKKIFSKKTHNTEMQEFRKGGEVAERMKSEL